MGSGDLTQRFSRFSGRAGLMSGLGVVSSSDWAVGVGAAERSTVVVDDVEGFALEVDKPFRT